MKEKGFTLIELIAVVVILSIVAVITTPKVLKAIESNKKTLFLNNVNELVKIMRSQQLSSASGESLTYTINNNSINPAVSYQREFTGQGIVSVDSEGNTVVSIQFGNEYCAYKAADDTEIILFDGLCNQAASEMGDQTKIFNYNNSYQTYTVPKNGYYKVEAWGAQGASSGIRTGGKGAYTSGNIYLEKGQVLYLYVGESPTTIKNAFNGGGKGGSSVSSSSGGGATDIRYFNNTPTQSDLLVDSTLGLKSRIMVAAGGGGSSSVVTGANGGYGALIGENGKVENTILGGITTATGGNTSTGGEGAIGTATASDGLFGQGGNATTTSGGGGGGGYYGGGGGTYTGANGSSGGGGSSYISGYAGTNSINSSGTHTTNTVHYSGKYFVDTSMTINDNVGNGKVAITFISENLTQKNNSLKSVRYIRDCIRGNSIDNNAHWVEIQAIYNGINVAKGKTVTANFTPATSSGTGTLTSITDGSINTYANVWQESSSTARCVTIDLADEYNLSDVAIWHYWGDSRTYNANVTSVSTNGTDWQDIIKTREPETQLGKRFSQYDQSLDRKNEKLDDVRYIMDCINGNSTNIYNSWIEIQALVDNNNVALGASVYDSQGKPAGATYANITNGLVNNNYGCSNSNTGYECVIVDLRAKQDLDEIAVWHYWEDGRTFNNRATYTSEDQNNWKLVMIGDAPESRLGKRVSAYEPDTVAINPNYTYNLPYTGSSQNWVVPQTGYYQIELWGAQGGTTPTSYLGGKGSYTRGIIYLESNTKLYTYVGGAGASGTAGVINSYVGGYNGGGVGYVDRDVCTQTAASGGGATDFRTISGLWNNDTSLKSRIMVASGGGGAFTEYCGTGDNATVTGGAGGGLVGGTAIYGSFAGFSALNPTGGTQTSGGQSLDGWTSTTYTTTYSGAFGLGASGGNSYSGGGGGYYGGASGVWQPGAGGSSFISGYAGVNAIKSSVSLTPTNNTIHYSNKYFVNGIMASGINTGNGKAKLTYLGNALERRNTSLNNVRYIKDCSDAADIFGDNTWVEIQAIYNGKNIAKGKNVTGNYPENATYPYSRIVDGDITAAIYSYPSTHGVNRCVTIDLERSYNLDEIAVWHYWGDNRTCPNRATSVSYDGINWVTVMTPTAAESVNGFRVNAFNSAP